MHFMFNGANEGREHALIAGLLQGEKLEKFLQSGVRVYLVSARMSVIWYPVTKPVVSISLRAEEPDPFVGGRGAIPPSW